MPRTICPPRLPSAALLAACLLTVSPGNPAQSAEPQLPGAGVPGAGAGVPGVFVWSPQGVALGRELALSGSPSVAGAVAALRGRADAMLGQPDVAVTDKKPDRVANSGDPHDYTSLSVYYWPDPRDPDAPWLREDGNRNHEGLAEFDGNRLFKMIDRVTDMGQAYYFTDDAKYAAGAADQLRTWFLDPATRMNPNLEYAQFIPNQSTGTKWGIIDANQVPRVLSAARLLAGSEAWTTRDEAGLRQWCRDFSTWLTTSPNGRAIQKAANNHGTYYDLLLSTVSMYGGDEETARRVLEGVKANRIATQIEPDGSVPHELARPDAADYVRFNLTGLMQLANLGEQVGVDLWHYETADGRGLREALEWTLPYVKGEKEWTYGKGNFAPTDFKTMYWWASQVYGEPFTQALNQHILPGYTQEQLSKDMVNLLLPPETADVPAPGSLSLVAGGAVLFALRRRARTGPW